MEDTNELLERLKSSRDIDSLTNYLDTIEDIGDKSIHEHLKKIMKDRKVPPRDLIRKSGIERTYCYQILNGRKKPGRDKILAIAIALNLELEDTQRMLAISHEGVLYAKSRRDSVIIYALNKKFNLIDTNALLLKYGEPELK